MRPDKDIELMKRTFLLFLDSLLCLAGNAQEAGQEQADADSTDMITLYQQMNEVTVQAEPHRAHGTRSFVLRYAYPLEAYPCRQRLRCATQHP